MRASFFGFNVAVSGLYTAQRNLDVVNHNLSNASTPGYSRQQSVQSASKPIATFDGTGMVGTGSEVTGVNRVRDEFLDSKYWSEADTSGEWETKSTLLSDIEATFNEPSDSGFTEVTNDFYNALQDLSKDPSSMSVRAVVRQDGITLAKYFNNLATHFEKMQSDINSDIKSKVQEINSLAGQIQQLNKQIYSTEIDGNKANDLRDQRTLLVDKLSNIVNVETNEVTVGKFPNGQEEKHFVVTISGKALVDHEEVTPLCVVQRAAPANISDAQGLYDVKWSDGNNLVVKSGELKGYLDVRDGTGASTAGGVLYKGIPYYQGMLNKYVQTFAQHFDYGYGTTPDHVSGHAEGYGLKGSDDINFFTMTDSSGNPLDTATFANDYSSMTAKNFSVSADVLGDPNKIAASDSDQQSGNANIINSLIKMRHYTGMFSEGAPEDFMKSLISTMGIDSQASQRFSDNQDNIVEQIDNQRLSISGVSTDEEMANLVKFQQAYNASAKMITTMAEVYDTLINKVGVA